MIIRWWFYVLWGCNWWFRLWEKYRLGVRLWRCKWLNINVSRRGWGWVAAGERRAKKNDPSSRIGRRDQLGRLGHGHRFMGSAIGNTGSGCVYKCGFVDTSMTWWLETDAHGCWLMMLPASGFGGAQTGIGSVSGYEAQGWMLNQGRGHPLESEDRGHPAPETKAPAFSP